MLFLPALPMTPLQPPTPPDSCAIVTDPQVYFVLRLSRATSPWFPAAGLASSADGCPGPRPAYTITPLRRLPPLAGPGSHTPVRLLSASSVLAGLPGLSCCAAASLATELSLSGPTSAENQGKSLDPSAPRLGLSGAPRSLQKLNDSCYFTRLL